MPFLPPLFWQLCFDSLLDNTKKPIFLCILDHKHSADAKHVYDLHQPADQRLSALQQMWEVPYLCHLMHVYQGALNLPALSLEVRPFAQNRRCAVTLEVPNRTPSLFPLC